MNGVYPCPKCKTRHPVDQLDDETGLCPACRGEHLPAPGRRSCAVCGKAIAGHSHRKTCSTRCRVALHRARLREDH
jgi:Uncharacterized protein containing a Zn-ribbon (DUF2116)